MTQDDQTKTLSEPKSEIKSRVFYSYDGDKFRLNRGDTQYSSVEFRLGTIPAAVLLACVAGTFGQRFTQSVAGATDGTIQEVGKRFDDFLMGVLARESFTSGMREPKSVGTKVARGWLIDSFQPYAAAAGLFGAFRKVHKTTPQDYDVPLPRDFMDLLLAKLESIKAVVRDGKKLTPNTKLQADLFQRRGVQEAIAYYGLHGVRLEGEDIDDGVDLSELD